ncbi:MAG: phosphotransferase [Actinomycetes bacterium]
MARVAPGFDATGLREVDGGWDNRVFRLGEDHAVRVPRRPEAERLILHELRWLPELAPMLPVRVPEPVSGFPPSEAIPVPWAIVSWCPGLALDREGSRIGHDRATVLAAALRALRRPAAPDAPANPYRGVPLQERDARARAALAGLPAGRRQHLARRWEQALAADGWTGPATWIHGDLHPGNLVVSGADLTAIIDWGDLAAGDPATDLSVAWTACDADGRGVLRDVIRPTEAEWTRAMGNALAHGLACIGSHHGDDRVRAIGEATLREVEGQ